ncbi:MAG: hypothetical protein WCL18_10630 [bacterium]
MKHLSLPQFLAKHDNEIKAALINNEDISMIIMLQHKLVFATEDDLVSFAGFLNHARVSMFDKHLKHLNVAVYMSLVDTAKARITLLSLLQGSDCSAYLTFLKEISI